MAGFALGLFSISLGMPRMKQMPSFFRPHLFFSTTFDTSLFTLSTTSICLDEKFPGWNQRSVVIPEGLFLPGLAGADIPVLNKLSTILKDNYIQSFEKGKSSYGIRLVENEPTTWFSKVMVSDIVASYWFNIDNSTAKYAYEWNKNNSFAYNDGLLKANVPWSGYWYPRGVSSMLYLFRSSKTNGNDFLQNRDNNTSSIA